MMEIGKIDIKEYKYLNGRVSNVKQETNISIIFYRVVQKYIEKLRKVIAEIISKRKV